MHPENDALQDRSVEAVVLAAEAGLDAPLSIDVQEDHLYVEDDLVFTSTAADNSFAPLFDAGVRRILVTAGFAQPSSVRALLDLLDDPGHHDDPATTVRRIWSSSIPGIDLDFGEHRTGLRGVRSFTALRLGAVPVATPPASLRAAIEREVAIDPAVRIVAALFFADDERRTQRRPDEVRFVCKMLENALTGLEHTTAAAILAATERCPLVDASQRAEVLSTARRTCDAAWWARAAEAAGADCREPLTAILVHVGIDRETADEVLALGWSSAAQAILHCAPDVPSPNAIQALRSRDATSEFDAHVLVGARAGEPSSDARRAEPESG